MKSHGGVHLSPLHTSARVRAARMPGTDLRRGRLLNDNRQLLVSGRHGLGGADLLGQLDPLVDHAVTVGRGDAAAALTQVLQLHGQVYLPWRRGRGVRDAGMGR